MTKREVWMATGVFLVGAVATVLLSSVPFGLVQVACAPSLNGPDVPNCQPAIARFAIIPIVLSALTIGGTAAVLTARKGIFIAGAATIVAAAGGGALAFFYWFNL